MDGLQKNWNAEGNDSCQVIYKMGTIGSGTNKSWWDNGQLKAESNYANGKLNGTYKSFNVSGQLESKSIYKDGKLEGPQIKFNYSPHPKDQKMGIKTIKFIDTYKNGEQTNRKMILIYKSGKEKVMDNCRF